MSISFGAICDEFSVTARLHLKLDLPTTRETVLHFLDRLRRDFPEMDRLRRRSDEVLVLEQGTDSPSRVWVRIERLGLRFGDVNPPDLDRPRRLAAVVLEQAPYHLTLSDLDIDRLDLTYSFDLDYRGNHDQLVSETFFGDSPLAGFLTGEHATHIIECQPCIGVALTGDCEVQAYVELRSRSTTYEACTGQHEPRPLTVSLSVRQYWSPRAGTTLLGIYDTLREHANRLAAEQVLPQIVNPLAQAIASRP
jgi:hypothetical protein